MVSEYTDPWVLGRHISCGFSLLFLLRLLSFPKVLTLVIFWINYINGVSTFRCFLFFYFNFYFVQLSVELFIFIQSNASHMKFQ